MKPFLSDRLRITFCLKIGALVLILSQSVANAGMAPDFDSQMDETVKEAVLSVANPKARTQSAPTFAVSLTGPNRIAVMGKKITNAIFDARQLDMQTEEATGQIFVFPKTNEPIALFVTTEDKETHALTLVPQAIRSQEIILGAKAPQRVKSVSSYQPKAFSEAIDAPDLDRRVTKLIRALARDELPDGFHATNRCGKGCIKLMANDELVGKVLLHTNTSQSTVTLEEKFFYERGVLAVALQKATLHPQDFTRIFVVMKNTGLQLSGETP
ncbi:MAG TPA: type-F conjugative transfer system secretin TraK [Candidatus Aphodousia faecavium]|nr:type-F conjugative transfer system secretin TraK [Candidatus Aphodousia faecavium]